MFDSYTGQEADLRSVDPLSKGSHSSSKPAFPHERSHGGSSDIHVRVLFSEQLVNENVYERRGR